jgi:hypothetical protein
MITKRLIVTLITGALLGIVCIIGANIRGTVESTYLLFALWYNRIIMGILIGVIDKEIPLSKRLIRGGILGLLVSFAYFASVGFTDSTSFVAGIVYGVIIEYAAYRFVD